MKTLKDLNLTQAARNAVLRVAQCHGAPTAAIVALARANRSSRATGITKIIRSTSRCLEVGCSISGELVTSWCNDYPMTKTAAVDIASFETSQKAWIVGAYPALVSEISRYIPHA